MSTGMASRAGRLSAAAALSVLALRDCRLVLGAALISVVGDGVLPVALAFAVLDQGGSPADLGLVLASRSVALAASVLFGGVLADTVGWRSVMVGADALRATALAAVGLLLVAGGTTIVEIALSQVLLGIGSGLFAPAASAALAAVAGERLQQANALRAIALAGGYVVGPAIGGALVIAAGAGAAILIDAGSFAASAVLLRRVAGDDRIRGPVGRRFLIDLRSGFAEVRARTWIWSTIVAFALVNMLAMGFSVLGPLVAKRGLGGAAAWATILSARAAGGAVGAIGSMRYSPRRPLLAVALGLATMILPGTMLAPPAPLVVVATAAVVSGIGMMVCDTLWQTTLQRRVPVGLRARVSSYDWLGSLALQPLGYMFAPLLGRAAGVATALYLCGGLQLLTVCALLLVKDVRGPAAPAGVPVPLDDCGARGARS